ncbi:MAG: hypothetical protein JST00_36285 [Deltaproteobacteria bacterium]|nr:hypothetical protein [Deltaproteobacteria bacterium]
MSNESLIPPTYLLENRYLAESVIKRGRMSEVFAGSDTWSGELVTIRRLREDQMELRDTFLRKGERMFGMPSARLVRAIHMGEDRDGRPFLVTERLTGRGVEALGLVRWEVAGEITRQAAAVIAEMHLSGLIHGSLEPASFFVAASNAGGSRVKLLDLGTAKRGATVADDVRALADILQALLKGDADAAPPVLLELYLPRWKGARGSEVTANEMAVELKALVDASAEGPTSNRAVPGPRVLPKSSVIVFDEDGYERD